MYRRVLFRCWLNMISLKSITALVSFEGVKHQSGLLSHSKLQLV
jgi:hypothetical protein